MIGPVGTAENERLTTRLGRDRYLRRRPAGFGEDTEVAERIAIAAAADRALRTATGTMSGCDPRIAAMATERAKAALAAIGCEPAAFTLLLSVPEKMAEAEVREYLRPAYAAAAFEDVTVVREKREDVLAHVSASGERISKEIESGEKVLSKPEILIENVAVPERTEATKDVANVGIIGAEGVSRIAGQTATAASEDDSADQTISANVNESNDETAITATKKEWLLVMAGTAGIEGTLLQYEANREAMEARYPKHFLQRIEELPKQAVTAEHIRAGLAAGAAVAVPGGDGGVYGALWKLGEKLRCGMKVELPAIPIAQITIEVCEVVDIDPYQIPAGGSALFVTNDPERLQKTLLDGSESDEKAPQIETAVIGYLSKEAARILCNRGEERYLEPYRGGV